MPELPKIVTDTPPNGYVITLGKDDLDKIRKGGVVKVQNSEALVVIRLHSERWDG